MPKRALVIVSDGCEDVETVAPIDILTRAGIHVTIASLVDVSVNCAYGNILRAHITLDQVTGVFDAIILPGGGKNAKTLAADKRVIELVKTQFASGRLVAAICASPGTVLVEAAGLLRGKPASGDPGFHDKLRAGGAIVTDADVTVSDNVITARGPAAAISFGLTISDYLGCNEAVKALAEKWRVGRVGIS